MRKEIIKQMVDDLHDFVHNNDIDKMTVDKLDAFSTAVKLLYYQSLDYPYDDCTQVEMNKLKESARPVFSNELIKEL